MINELPNSGMKLTGPSVARSRQLILGSLGSTAPTHRELAQVICVCDGRRECEVLTSGRVCCGFPDVLP